MVDANSALVISNTKLQTLRRQFNNSRAERKPCDCSRNLNYLALKKNPERSQPSWPLKNTAKFYYLTKSEDSKCCKGSRNRQFVMEETCNPGRMTLPPRTSQLPMYALMGIFENLFSFIWTSGWKPHIPCPWYAYIWDRSEDYCREQNCEFKSYSKLAGPCRKMCDTHPTRSAKDY